MYINISKVDFGKYYRGESGGGGEVVDLDYMTLSALGDGEITITIPKTTDQNYATSLSYSKDKSNWTETVVDNTDQTITIPVTNGENVYLKGVAKSWNNADEGFNTHIDSSANINASGNIMSLLYEDNFEDKTVFPDNSNSAFSFLFVKNAHLINAENLILPATTLSDGCYNSMFSECTSLTTSPELPATTLAMSCYGTMFFMCTSLTTAPELPATTLAMGCYMEMFSGCTSLTAAPELPATTLADYCYYDMFSGCSSLNNITMLATDISASNCLYSWVSDVAATGTFTKAASMTSLPTGASGIPEGWTVKNYGDVGYSQEYMTLSALGDGEITISIPAELSSTYATSLSYSKDKSNWSETLIDDTEQTITIPVTSGDNVYLKGVAKAWSNNDEGVGAQIGSSANINVSGNIMSLLYGDNFKDKTTFSNGSNYVFELLFVNNSHLINAENLILPATTLTAGCYSGMFMHCDSLTTAPELPATTLAMSCYQLMFLNCSNLNSITMLATDISAKFCLTNWVSRVAATGTFTKAASMTSLPTGASGIPEGWTVVDYGAA